MANADFTDTATERELEANERRVEANSWACKPQQLPLPDGSYAVTECDDCGLGIPPERLKVAIKNRLCVHCADVLEKRGRFQR